jgi:hypothetical protein
MNTGLFIGRLIAIGSMRWIFTFPRLFASGHQL